MMIMPTATQKLEKLDLSKAISSYPALGNEYTQPEYSISYSPILTRTGNNYYDSKVDPNHTSWTVNKNNLLN
jgi:hypothetical protein